MTKDDSRPPHRHSRALLALFAVTAALAGGAQVLAPAPAPALQTEYCSEWDQDSGDCTHVNEGPAEGGTWEEPSESGDGVGADNGFGQDWGTNDDGDDTDSQTDSDPGWNIPKQSEEDRKTDEWVKKERPGLPVWITDDKKFGEAIFRRSLHKVCTALQRRVRQRIYQIGADDSDDGFEFDWIENPSDKRLRRLEDAFDSEGCRDVLHVPL